MTCADARAVITMEIFMKGNIVTPVWVALECFIPTKNWSTSMCVSQKDIDETMRNLVRDLTQGDFVARMGGIFHQEIVAIVMMKLLNRFDDQIVDRKPDRTTPVRVTAK